MKEKFTSTPLPGTGSPRPPHAEEDYLAKAYWRQRSTLNSYKTATRELHDTLRRNMPPDHPGDLPFHEWAKLMALALDFQPDLILELGRGYGNSTCVFLQAAQILRPRPCQVLSLCLTPWDDMASKLAAVVDPAWFAPLALYVGDMREFDFSASLAQANRVLVFWDAHGYEVAECVLGGIMPLLADKEHLVVMHDMEDARYLESSSYGGFGVWKGEMAWPGPKVRLGNVLATVTQAVSAVDFTSRNGISLFSAAHSMHEAFSAQPGAQKALRDALGADMFDMASACMWFTLNQRPGPYFFPALVPPAAGSAATITTSPGQSLPSQAGAPPEPLAVQKARQALERARALAAAGEVQKALEGYREVVAVLPPDHAILCEIGFLCVSSGALAQARQCYEQALSMNPAHVGPRFNLAVLDVQDGRLEQAREHLRQCLRLEPSLQQAREMLSSLEA